MEATRTPTAVARAIAGASSLRLAEGLPAQAQAMECEARAARFCLPDMAQLAREHPLWMAHYDDVDADTADIDVLVGLLETAPTDFARGIIFGKLTLRSQIAAVSGRPF